MVQTGLAGLKTLHRHPAIAQQWRAPSETPLQQIQALAGRRLELEALTSQPPDQPEPRRYL